MTNRMNANYTRLQQFGEDRIDDLERRRHPAFTQAIDDHVAAGVRAARERQLREQARQANLPPAPPPPPMKTGGLIKRTGVYTLHKGEVVVPAHRVKTVDMALKKDKKVPLKK